MFHDTRDRNASVNPLLQQLLCGQRHRTGRRAGTFYEVPGPQRRREVDHDQDADGAAGPVLGGQIKVLGRDMLDPREALEAKRHMGVIPKTWPCFDNLTAARVPHLRRPHPPDARETIRSRSEELLSILGLQDEEKKLTLEYSHGMKKKLAMAAAALPNPDLLFLDEPFEGVDAVTSRVIRDLLAGFVARGRRSF